MSENQSPQNSSDSQPANLTASMKGVSQLLSNDDPQQTALPLNCQPMDLWEATEAPQADNQVSDRTDNQASEKPVEQKAVKQQGVGQKPIAPASEPTNGTTRENELLVLIHDLNDCNDVLLTRVAQLESDLKKTSSTLKAELEQAKAEVEQTKEAAKSVQERMAQQVSAEHAAAQQMAHNAQQQVAKLLSQLEVAEQEVSRQRLINENLQTELSNSQERNIQLERECALIAQEHAEQARARIEAETTARDLRSRLQRQQRYTLQFKAALEKSLSVSAQPVNSPEAVRLISFQDPASFVMPKAHRIMPWAAGGDTTPFQGIDPHLEVLIRGASKPSEPKVAIPQPPAAASSEATAELWQDLERVLSTDTQAAQQAAQQVAQRAAKQAAQSANASDTVISPEVITSETVKPSKPESPALPSSVLSSAALPPKLNWQSKSTAESEPEASPVEADIVAPVEPIAPAASTQSEPEVLFTEPSPWGNPLAEKAATAQVTAETAAVSQDYLPATSSPTASTVSPGVKPLRSPKKIGSMASVELPTFPNAKVGSFKR